MTLIAAEVLPRLGSGESIASICETAGVTRAEFDEWWRATSAARVPAAKGTKAASVRDDVRIERDEAGLPHVFAGNDEDLFFGFGYATAQDRLFQLDYLRRRALGRLSEVLGPAGLELDLTARTVGLHRIAAAEWERLPEETRRLINAYTYGVNALIRDSRDNLPIEFDLLGYAPELWSPQDSVAIAVEFRWYLTGRFPVIVIPELAKRVLGDGPLYQAFLQPEADGEAILPRGEYPTSPVGVQPVGVTVNDPQEGSGSNNWVVSGTKAASDLPLLASDPHIAFAAVSCWHEIRLTGGTFNVTGIAYAGMPGIMLGRNERVAFGITNNICSLRDLYQERTDPAHPGCFLYDGQWEPAREITEIIDVKGENSVRRTVRLSRNGPIVDEILPPAARDTGPVSLKWLGASPCGWLTALINMDRAKTCAELRQATEPWLVPTFCVVSADIFGHIGYQCTGRIPIRSVWERGYRPGWDPQHQWTGLIPFDGMPRCENPSRGWIGTANNRVAADDFPYPLSGTWANGFRAVRVRQMLEGQEHFRRQDFARMQQDSMSLRAVDCVPRLLDVLQTALDDFDAETNRRRRAPERAGSAATADHVAPLPLTPGEARRIREAVEHLAVWDCRMEPDRVAASIFTVFFTQWSQRIAEERFPAESASLVAGAIGGLASDLLQADRSGWFGANPATGKRQRAIVETFVASLRYLQERFGADSLDWRWGRLHTLEQKHFLSGRGELGTLLDRGGVAVRGDSVTVCNSGQGPDFTAPTGAGYRLIADLADPQAGLWAIDAGSASGHPGSPHYDDQLPDWLTARYHYVPLKSDGAPGNPDTTLTLTPAR